MTRPVVVTGDIFRLQPRGGITRVTIEIARRLDRPVRVIAGLHQSKCLDELGHRVAAAVAMPAFKGSPYLRSWINRIVDRLQLGDVQDAIIHPSYYRDPDSLPADAPLVVTVHDMAHERLPQAFRQRWWSMPDPARHKLALCRRAERIVCVSEATRSDLLEHVPEAAERARVVHNGLNDWSAITARALPEVRAPFLLWVGERSAYKNFLDTVRAWAACPAARPTTLLCAGGGGWRAHERNTIDSLGVGPRIVQRTLSNGELRWAYEHTAGLLLTSKWEGFGLPLIEALSFGCPVVASNIAALREVADGHAIEVDPNDVESIAAGIGVCLSRGRDPQRVAAGRARAARFSWDACAAGYEAVYRELD